MYSNAQVLGRHIEESRKYGRRRQSQNPRSSTFSSSDNNTIAPAQSRTMLTSLKNKLHKSKDLADSKMASPTSLANDHPASNTAPPTRRPDRPNMNAFTVPSNEPPPAYSPTAPANSSPAPANVAQPAPVTQTTTPDALTAAIDDSEFSFLATFDTIFLIDDSGSMAGRGWRETSLALEAITPICTKYDHDGIDILFLNTPEQPFHRNVTTVSTVHEIFSTVRPHGGTPMGQRLNQILKPYLRQLEQNPDNTKPVNIIVVTDGVPSDDPESVLIAAAKKLDRLEAEAWQVGVQFFQVGEEEGAQEYLQSLDDELSRQGGGCRDIVDTVPFHRGPNGRGIALSAEMILKVVLGAVNKRLDRRQNAPRT